MTHGGPEDLDNTYANLQQLFMMVMILMLFAFSAYVPVQTLIITCLITYLHSSRTTTSVILLTDNFLDSTIRCCELILER